jgi:hypothetical protein
MNIKLSVSAEVKATLDQVLADITKYRGFAVMVDKETVVLDGQALEASDNVEADFANIREALSDRKGAYYVLQFDGKLTLLTYVSDALPPRQKMLYASGSVGFREDCDLAGANKVNDVKDITPALFTERSHDRVELRSEKEVAQAKIAAMYQEDMRSGGGVRAHAMHGTGCEVSPDTLTNVQAVSKDELAAVVLQIENATVVVSKAVDKNGSLDDAAAALVADEPRFIYLAWLDEGSEKPRHLLLYVVPEGCKPRVRMMYAASKAALVQKFKSAEIPIDRNVELNATAAEPLSNGEGLKRAVSNSIATLVENPPVTEEPQPPVERKMVKGPRMFMP